MSRLNRVHNLIVGNIVAELHARHRGWPCEAYVSQMRVKVSPTGMYTYPDVRAVCGEPRFEDAHGDTLLSPTVIIEVLSPSTEAYDRGEKFAHYRRLLSLTDYVLVAQDKMRVEHFARSGDKGDQWLFTEISDPDHALNLPSIGCAVTLRNTYDKVQFPSSEHVERNC